MADTPPWLPKAASYIGFHEIGNNRGLDHFIELAHTGENGDPWCAIFVNACLEEVGIPGTRSALARSFEHHENFVQLAGPALGAITTMWRGSPSAGTGHVYFYLGENSHGNVALGGNQDDQVKRQYEPQHPVTGYWWPKSYPLPITGKIILPEATALTGPLPTATMPLPALPPAPTIPAPAWQSGKGSWYSQYSGREEWVDKGDEPGSNKLGVPDDCQGISFFNKATLGHWFLVRAPNGVISLEQQTDLGPHPRTGRTIDISAVCAETRFGYRKANFPTDGIFSWQPASPPTGFEHLSPQQQAIQYARQRPTMSSSSPAPAPSPVPTPTPAPAPTTLPAPPLQLDPVVLEQIVNAVVPELEKMLVPVLHKLEQKIEQGIASPEGQATLAALLGKLAPALFAAFPQLAVFGGLIQVVLTVLGVVGMPAGSAATTTGSITAATLIATLVSGLLGRNHGNKLT